MNGPKRYDATIVIDVAVGALSIALGGGGYGQRNVLAVVLLEGDGRDRISFEDLVGVGRVLQLAEDGVPEIEARIVDEIDEELGVAGVAATRRQADGSRVCDKLLISSRM